MEKERAKKRTRRESEKEEQSATNLLAVRTKAPSLDVSASADTADILDNLGDFDRILFRANAESVAATTFNRSIKKNCVSLKRGRSIMQNEKGVFIRNQRRLSFFPSYLSFSYPNVRGKSRVHRTWEESRRGIRRKAREESSGEKIWISPCI